MTTVSGTLIYRLKFLVVSVLLALRISCTVGVGSFC